MKTLISISEVFILFLIVSCSKPDALISPLENSLVGNWKLVNVTMPIFQDAPEHGKKIGTILSLKINNDYTLDDGEKLVIGKYYIEKGYLRLYSQNELLLNYDEYKLSTDQLKMTYYWVNEETRMVYIYNEEYIKL